MNEKQMEIVKEILDNCEIRKNIFTYVKELIGASKELSAIETVKKATFFYLETVRKCQNGYFLYLSYGNNRSSLIIYGITPDSEFAISEYDTNYGGINGYEMKEETGNAFMSYVKHCGWGNNSKIYIDKYGNNLGSENTQSYGSCCN